ncbi:hypothetical protein C475_21529 [Halosimplex carlsbadense 2-9-1]|uniref:DUF2795 domain-containing protein n=1 Tax=Halosimplex carlsbadense 2-9-1 TaxID=797114 RepID=M0CC50_9EURY|nr:hypothetical protein [Halosimplex carlsbadense]ELZ19922.1 hypothetical protein C475_21529 [Halosimplex carlsbadense 2-9-1]
MSDDGDSYDPDPERVQESAVERRRERDEIVEDELGRVGDMLGEAKYPTTSEELAVEYGDQRIDMANETESLGSVFDRLVDERFDSAAEAREAIYNELTGEAAGPEEYNDERALGSLDDDERDGGVRREGTTPADPRADPGGDAGGQE